MPRPAAAVVPAPITPSVPVTDELRAARGLSRTKAFFQQTFDKLFSGAKAEEFFGDMEEVLLTADIGIDFSEKVVAALKSSFGVTLPGRSELKSKLSDILLSQLPVSEVSVDARPRVVMIIGVNGAGKTTTIAKLCQRFQSQGKKILVGAADTFRAAAIEQLKTWIDRVGAEGVFQNEGADPSAVAFDAVQAAVSRHSDICLIDTAGRLHTKLNLMEELKKMKRVMGKAMPGAPHDVWLVVDGSTGQNALNQAREFHQHLELTGVVVTKLDGSAKGGAVLAIASELKVPVVFIGVGETPEDLIPFNGPRFVDTILEGL
ncbi:MAG: signal recognition particle-docking protein FtsY [Deltaproteobacteria bacterium]|nr:signal recognition particle-docking protein FtsY [Deltaproteobacteria bacterium]